ncbi:MAG: hypothetical protein J2P41_13085 [Blastocatellia bacterium]|nr:hypothetical protein [Blastocatellia bacterium]
MRHTPFRSISIFLYLFYLFVLLVSSAVAQTATGTVRGTVYDRTRRRIRFCCRSRFR